MEPTPLRKRLKQTMAYVKAQVKDSSLKPYTRHIDEFMFWLHFRHPECFVTTPVRSMLIEDTCFAACVVCVQLLVGSLYDLTTPRR